MLLVQDIYNTSFAQFTHNQKNNMLPDIFKNFFKPIAEIHCHKRTEQGKLMTNYRGTLIWNNLPNTITAIKMTASFKRQTKIFYINKL